MVKLRLLVVAFLVTSPLLCNAGAKNQSVSANPPSTSVQQPPTDQTGDVDGASDLGPCVSQQGLTVEASTEPIHLATETRYVIDQAGALTQECAADLSHRLAVLERDKGAQLRILIVRSLDGEDLESYTSNAFHTWRLGRKGIDDGVLLVVAMDEHRDRIEVGYGLEGAIPDGLAGDILRSDLEPHFKAGEYNSGVSEAVEGLEQRICTEPLVAPHPHHSAGAKFAYFVLAMILCVIAVATGTAQRWSWGLRLSAPLGIALVMELLAAKLYLVGGYAQAFVLTIVLGALSGLGVLIVVKRKAFRDWLGCCVLVGFVLTLLWLLIALKLNFGLREWGSSFLLVLIGSALFGSLTYLFAPMIQGTGRPTRDRPSWKANRSSSSWSSSDSNSSDWSSSISTGSSDSGSSGGGGDSGGGGASGSW